MRKAETRFINQCMHSPIELQRDGQAAKDALRKHGILAAAFDDSKITCYVLKSMVEDTQVIIRKNSKMLLNSLHRCTASWMLWMTRLIEFLTHGFFHIGRGEKPLFLPIT